MDQSCQFPSLGVATFTLMVFMGQFYVNLWLCFISAVCTQNECAPVDCVKTSVVLNCMTTTMRDPPYACRNEELRFNCEVVNGASLQWASEPEICRSVPISFASSDNEGEPRRRGSFQSNLTSVIANPPNSNFSSVLTYSPPGNVNSVMVVCGDQLSSCSSTEDEITLTITGKCML